MRIPANLRLKFFNEAVKNGMKVLTLDTETSHMLVRTFYIGQKVSIQHHQVKVPTKIITIQYKWYHEKQAKYLEWDKVDTKYDDTRNFDDSSMIEEFVTNVIDKADIIIGQNLDAFDIKVLNERAKALHLPTISPKPSIDILKLSRKSFRAASHKLDYRSEQQGLGGKIKMVDDDWIGIEERHVSVRKKMVPYGLKDVVDTEQLAIKKELSYYKDLPVAIEKVILSFMNQPKAKKTLDVYCKICRQKRQKATNIKSFKDYFKCLNCTIKWEK